MAPPNLVDEYWTVNGVSINSFIQHMTLLTETIPLRRGQDRIVPYRRGNIWVPKFYDPRKESYGMLVSGRDPNTGAVPLTDRAWNENLNANLDALKQLFGKTSAQLALTRRIRLPGGIVQTRSALAECVGQLNATYEGGGRAYARFTIDLNYADPLWYTPAIAITLPITPRGQQMTTVTNPGTADVWSMTLQLNGKWQGPIISNASLPIPPDNLSNTRVGLSELIAAGHFVTLDTGAFTAIDDASQNHINHVFHFGAIPWLKLQPGANVLITSSSALDDTGSCLLTFQPAFL